MNRFDIQFDQIFYLIFGLVLGYNKLGSANFQKQSVRINLANLILVFCHYITDDILFASGAQRKE